MPNLIEQTREKQEAEAAGQAATREQAKADFVRLLLRAENPEAGDAERMVEVLATLGLNDRAIEPYLKDIRRFNKLRKLHETATDAHKAMMQAREAHEEAKRRAAEMVRQATREYQLAQTEYSRRANAKGEAARLAKRSPLLFTTRRGADFPEVHGEA